MQSFASTQLADEILLSLISQIEANARELSMFTTIVATVIALHALQLPMHHRQCPLTSTLFLEDCHVLWFVIHSQQSGHLRTNGV